LVTWPIGTSSIRGGAEREGRQPEGFVAGSPPELEQVVDLGAATARETFQVAAGKLDVEALVPGGNGRVRREDGRPPDALERLVEREALVLDERPDALQREEGRVTLVQVIDGRLEPQSDEGPCPTDPQQHLLADPVLAVGPVQDVGDGSRGRVVLLHVRVEEVDR